MSPAAETRYGQHQDRLPRPKNDDQQNLKRPAKAQDGLVSWGDFCIPLSGSPDTDTFTADDTERATSAKDSAQLIPEHTEMARCMHISSSKLTWATQVLMPACARGLPSHWVC